MAILEGIRTEERLSQAFARLLGTAPTSAERSPRLGIEQEYFVRRGADTIDYRDVAPRLERLGVAVHPTDPSVHLTPSGVALAADSDVAEAASPPVRLGGGFTSALERWAALGARLLGTTLEPGDRLDGASTHLSVEVDPAVNDRLCLAYAETYAPGMMLLLDRRDSPGLLVRPRPARAELCGEFAAGSQLRAAAAYAAGSVLAAARDLADGSWSGPPPADVALEPARRRYGWYVSREAFGPDLYRQGRAATLRRRSGGTATAQAYLEWGWDRARAALAPFVAAADLSDADDAVAARMPLPLESAAPAQPAPRREPRAEPIGMSTRARDRAGMVIRLHTATWDVAMFEIAGPSRTAVAVVPQAALPRFLQLLDAGQLDDTLAAYLEVERRDGSARIVARAADTTKPSLADTISRSADLLPDDRAGVGPGAIDPLRPGKRVLPAVVDDGTQAGRALPWIPGRLGLAILGAGLLIGAALGSQIGGGQPAPTPLPVPSASRAPATATRAAPFDPCTLVTPAEATVILSSSTQQTSVTADSGPPPSAQCRYKATPQAVFPFRETSRIARIRIDAVVVTIVTDSSATSRWYAKQALYGKDPDDAIVSSLGDSAIFTGGQDLSVLQGNAFLNVGTRSDRDWGEGKVRYEDVYQKYLSIVEAFAKAALPRIPQGAAGRGAAGSPQPSATAAAAPASVRVQAQPRDPLPGILGGGLFGLLVAGAALFALSRTGAIGPLVMPDVLAGGPATRPSSVGGRSDCREQEAALKAAEAQLDIWEGRLDVAEGAYSPTAPGDVFGYMAGDIEDIRAGHAEAVQKVHEAKLALAECRGQAVQQPELPAQETFGPSGEKRSRNDLEVM